MDKEVIEVFINEIIETGEMKGYQSFVLDSTLKNFAKFLNDYKLADSIVIHKIVKMGDMSNKIIELHSQINNLDTQINGVKSQLTSLTKITEVNSEKQPQSKL